MLKKLIFILFMLLCVSSECNGHLGLLDIVSGAHDRIHSTVDKVAGGFLGGFNVNFQSHVGLGGQRQPSKPHPNSGEQQTVIVVVKEEDQNNGHHGMRPTHYGQESYNNYNGPNRPGYNNNQGQFNGNNNGNPNPYGNQNNGNNQYGNHHHPGHNGRPHYQGQNNNQQGTGQNNYGNGGYNQRPQQPDNNDQLHNNFGNDGYNQRPQQPNQGDNQPNQGHNQPKPTTEGYHDNGGNNSEPPVTKKQEETKPTFGSIHEEPTQKPEKTTEKDGPLFVPLNPNQYSYEGDKITNNAPKREADKDKKAEDEDEDFPIDIRFQDQ